MNHSNISPKIPLHAHLIPPDQLARIVPELQATLRPETDIEHRLLSAPEFVTGLQWGIPRYGHPEGEVYKHVREVLDNIDRLQLTAADRERLRLIAFAHDTFKYAEDKSHPRDWSKHHGILARQFLERFTNDGAVLRITEWHDEAYYCWRFIHLFEVPQKGAYRLEQLLNLIGPYRQLFYLFFKCDTCTGDKNLAPLKWFEQSIAGIDIVTF